MARTPDEVVSDFEDEYRIIDPSVDVQKGPVYDFVLRPNSRFVAELEESQDRTDRLSSGDFASAATSEELIRMAGSVGTGPLSGNAATTTQVFGTYSRPKAGQIIPIPQGTLVSSSDGQLIFQTTGPAQIDGNFSDVYFNPSRRTYEVEVPIQAVAAGSVYNLPPFRIRSLVTPISGIDYTENRKQIDDGRAAGTVEDLVDRAQAAFQGRELGTIGGLERAVKEAFEGVITDTSVVTSADQVLFRRIVSGPALDIYYVGSRSVDVSTTFTADGGELTLTIPQKPVLSVEQLLVNGSAVTWELVVDTDPATRGSLNDQSYILLQTALTTGDAVFIRYKYDSLTEAINTSFAGDQSLFAVNTLPRRPVVQAPKLQIEARAMSNFNPFTLRSNIESVTVDFFVDAGLGASFLPTSFLDYLEKEVVGLAGRPTLSIFQLPARSFLDIEPISLNENEVIEIDFDIIDLDVQ